MVVIRLARGGAKHNPKYRITVADQRQWVKGKFIEIIGFYDPKAQGAAEKLKIDMAKANEWIKKGAQPTERVKSLLKQAASH
jgi:small subunit ribosomal protein S16